MKIAIRATKMAIAPETYVESLWNVKDPDIGCNAKDLSVYSLELASRWVIHGP